jgi:hypothetical protein
MVPQQTLDVDRSVYQDLMLQLDPKYVPPAAAKPDEPVVIEAPKPVLDVKITGEPVRLSGQIIEYKVRVSNTGKIPADGNVSVKLPVEGGKLVSLPPKAKFAVQSRRLSWRLEPLEPGQTLDLAFSYLTSIPGVYRASVDVTLDEDTKFSDTFSTEVQAIAALDLQVTQTSRSIEVGKTTHYDITIKNAGNKPAAKLDLSGKLTRNLRIVKVFGAANGDVDFNNQTGQVLFPMIERLEPGATITISLEVEALEAGPADCRVFLGHSEMAPGSPMIEDVISTTVTKPK